MNRIFGLLVAFWFSFSASGDILHDESWIDQGNGCCSRVTEISGHEYIIVNNVSGGITVIHSYSCPCFISELITNSVKQVTEPRLFPKAMRLRKYEEQNGICSHCTNRFEFAEMEGDHIIPYSKGGKTVYENLQMLCKPCNRKKSNRYSW